jgi:hypothetical protein
VVRASEQLTTSSQAAQHASLQTESASAGARASRQQKIGFSRSVSQHGSVAGSGVGATYTVGALLGHSCNTHPPTPTHLSPR